MKMEIQKAKKILEKIETNYEIKNRKYKGIFHLNKFCDEMDFSSGHDQIWLNDFEKTIEKMSENDVKYLAELGFFEDEDSWSFFT